MSLDIETRLRQFLASAPQNIRRIQTLEISHSAMSKTYYLWREPYAGTIGTGDGTFDVEFVAMEIKLAGDEGDLDQQYTINLDTTDIEDEFREQLDLVPLDTLEKIRCVYREYLSDDLTVDGILATAVLQVESITYHVGVATLQAISPRLNVTRTGELMVPRDVPMLRAFL